MRSTDRCVMKTGVFVGPCGLECQLLCVAMRRWPSSLFVQSLADSIHFSLSSHLNVSTTGGLNWKEISQEQRIYSYWL